MSQKFHNYKFKIKEKSSLDLIDMYHKIEICSKNIDGNIFLYATNGVGDYSLYLQERFFYFSIDNATKNISAFAGDLSINALRYEKIQFPIKITNVVLSLDTNDELLQGCGGYIRFDNSKIYYDETQKILQLGNVNPNETVYKFFKNGFAQIKNNKLSGLIFTEIIL